MKLCHGLMWCLSFIPHQDLKISPHLKGTKLKVHIFKCSGCVHFCLLVHLLCSPEERRNHQDLVQLSFNTVRTILQPSSTIFLSCNSFFLSIFIIFLNSLSSGRLLHNLPDLFAWKYHSAHFLISTCVIKFEHLWVTFFSHCYHSK